MSWFPKAAVTNSTQCVTETTDAYSTDVLEARGLKFRCRQRQFLPQVLRENPNLFRSWQWPAILACRHIAPTSASVSYGRLPGASPCLLL